MSREQFEPYSAEMAAQKLAERLFCIAGTLAKYRDTGGHLSLFEVRTLVAQLDQAASEAEWLRREIGEVADMICDLAEPPAAPPAFAGAGSGRVARLRPPLTVLPGGRGA